MLRGKFLQPIGIYSLRAVRLWLTGPVITFRIFIVNSIS